MHRFRIARTPLATRTALVAVAALVGLVALTALVACGDRPPDEARSYDNVMAFDSARVRLVASHDTLTLTVQLAVSPQQRTMGLMERRHLADDHGMLFVYDSTQPGTAGFWMYRTRIPLDIAFLDSAGTVRAIRSMEPCPTTIPEGCPAYEPGTPWRFALEVNAGYFARNRVPVGGRILLGDVPDRITRQPATPE